MNETHHSPAPLSSLEISGAICARVIHDLANLVSGILGNAEYAQRADANPAHLQKALQAITLSANSAGKLLGQCLPLQHFVSRAAFPYPTAELAADIAEAACLAPGWSVNAPPPLTGDVSVQPRWLSAAIWQLARETEVTSGEINFACGPAVFPVVWSGANPNVDHPIQLFQITLRLPFRPPTPPQRRNHQSRALRPPRRPGNHPPLQSPNPLPPQASRPSGNLHPPAAHLNSPQYQFRRRLDYRVFAIHPFALNSAIMSLYPRQPTHQ